MELIFTNFRKDREEGKTEPQSRRERNRRAAESAEFAGDNEVGSPKSEVRSPKLRATARS